MFGWLTRVLFLVLFVGAVVFGCSVTGGGDSESAATRVPAVMPTDIPSPTPMPVGTPQPGATATAVAEREAYCRDHALPTPTPNPGETPTPVPTSPPGIPLEDMPSEWLQRMDEMEVWVRDHYGMDETEVGSLERRFVDEEVWRQWRSDTVADWAEDEDSHIDLWEQVYRTFTLLSPNSDYQDFLKDYYSEQVIGLYDYDKREFFVLVDDGEFDFIAEIIYVHEYAHHVQNEKYDFPFFDDCFSADRDAWNANRALLEGDAVSTQSSYIHEVIGWDHYAEFWHSREDEDIPDEDNYDESLMFRFMRGHTDFTYTDGLGFVIELSWFGPCDGCTTSRERIDVAFEEPPFATEQILLPEKYYNREEPFSMRWDEDFWGEGWERQYAGTIGRAAWINFLATLVDGDREAIGLEHPGWRGDYFVLFEGEDGDALYLEVVEWENNRYAESLVAAFDGRSRLSKVGAISVGQSAVGGEPFDEFYVWQGDTGSIAIGVEFLPVDGFYRMFLAVGPDQEAVVSAVYAGRDGLVVE